jgi:hypothetical protein
MSDFEYLERRKKQVARLSVRDLRSFAISALHKQREICLLLEPLREHADPEVQSVSRSVSRSANDIDLSAVMLFTEGENATGKEGI